MKHSAHLRQRWIIMLVPLILGLMVAALLTLGGLASTALSVRARLDALSVYTGLLSSLLIALGLGLRASAERRCAQQMTQLQSQTADDQRRLIERAALDRHRLLNNCTTNSAAP
jgi:hypothetical protein